MVDVMYGIIIALLSLKNRVADLFARLRSRHLCQKCGRYNWKVRPTVFADHFWTTPNACKACVARYDGYSEREWQDRCCKRSKAVLESESA